MIAYIDDTNSFDYNNPKELFYTDVLFYELTKGKCEEDEYESNLKTVRRQLIEGKAHFVGSEKRWQLINKILNKNIHYSSQLCKKMCKKIHVDFCQTYFSLLCTYTLIVFAILTKTKFEEDNIVIRDVESRVFAEVNYALGEINDDIISTKALFKESYCEKDTNFAMTKIGTDFVNLLFRKINENVGDRLHFTLPQIEKVDGMPLKEMRIRNIDKNFLTNIVKIAVNVMDDKDIWQDIFATYLYENLKSCEVLEFNDISDMVQVFWCKKFGCKLRTIDKKIKRFFPDLVADK